MGDSQGLQANLIGAAWMTFPEFGIICMVVRTLVLVHFLPCAYSIPRHMNPRTFLRSLLALMALLVVLGSTGCSTTSSSSSVAPQYYELRTYTTKTEAQQKLISDYWKRPPCPPTAAPGSRPSGCLPSWRIRRARGASY
jgi:hypothetical protein